MGENTEDLDILFRQAALKAQARAEKAEKALAKGRFSNLYRTRDKFSYSQFCAQRAQVRAKQKRRQSSRDSEIDGSCWRKGQGTGPLAFADQDLFVGDFLNPRSLELRIILARASSH